MPTINRVKRSDLPKAEADVLRECREWLAKQPDISIHRNGTGQVVMAARDFTQAGLSDAHAKIAAQAVFDRFRAMKFGLAVGGSDLIGSITIDACRLSADLGGEGRAPRKMARALAIEIKKPGEHPTDDQYRFLEAKKDIGWVAFWADDLSVVIEAIERARRWMI